MPQVEGGTGVENVGLGNEADVEWESKISVELDLHVLDPVVGRHSAYRREDLLHRWEVASLRSRNFSPRCHKDYSGDLTPDYLHACPLRDRFWAEAGLAHLEGVIPEGSAGPLGLGSFEGEELAGNKGGLAGHQGGGEDRAQNESRAEVSHSVEKDPRVEDQVTRRELQARVRRRAAVMIDGRLSRRGAQRNAG